MKTFLLLVIVSALPVSGSGQRVFERIGKVLVRDSFSGSKPLMRLVASFLGGAIVFSTSVIANAEEPATSHGVWQEVSAEPASHLRSSFYLFLDFSDGWRVMHVQYLGASGDGEYLFVGPRIYILDNILPQVESSLVGLDGLLNRDVMVKEVASFIHPRDPVFDLTVLAIKDVDLEEYEPLDLASFPPPNTSLELLLYIADRGSAFAHPAMRQDCVAVDSLREDHFGIYTCKTSLDPSLVLGAPIFAKEARTLVAFHFGSVDSDLSYGGVAPFSLLRFSRTVVSAEKISVTWGDIKKGI